MTTLKDLEIKEKQYGEALSLLDRIAGDVMYAIDFCCVHEIKQELENVLEMITAAEYGIGADSDENEEELERVRATASNLKQQLDEVTG